MTDKPIIIDGVNVSGCKLYRDEISFVGGEIYTDVCSIWIWQRDYSGLEPSCVMKCHCSDNPNCLFKQLARKKQDEQSLLNVIDYLQKQKNEFKINYNDLGQEYDQLKAENEELKERFKNFHDRKLDESADLLCKLHKEECLKFKVEQKLERIEAYCKEQNLKADYTACEILQIIDEVE